MSNLSYKIIYATQSGNAQQFAEDLGKAVFPKPKIA